MTSGRKTPETRGRASNGNVSLEAAAAHGGGGGVMARQLTMFDARDDALDEYRSVLERARERNSGSRNPCLDWYTGVPIVGTMPPHDAEWLAERFCAMLDSLPERVSHRRAQLAIEARRARSIGYPTVVRGAGHALSWWTPERRFIPDLRTATRRRIERWLRVEATYDRHSPPDGFKWGLAGALRRHTPWLCDDVWRSLPQRLRDAVLRATVRLPPCVGELIHPVTIWWSLAPRHALRRLGLESP